MLGGVVAAVVTRRVGAGVIGVTSGVALAAAAHLFRPGTLREEITAILRHPVWSVRAEGQRIFGPRR